MLVVVVVLCRGTPSLGYGTTLLSSVVVVELVVLLLLLEKGLWKFIVPLFGEAFACLESVLRRSLSSSPCCVFVSIVVVGGKIS